MKILKYCFALSMVMTINAVAHHSPSQFDLTTLTTIDGVVSKLQWTNPHAFIQLMVTNPEGETEEWSMELPATAGLLRNGWHANSLKSGDKVTIVYNPLRSGGHGGFALGVTLPDGKTLGQSDVQKMRIDNATIKNTAY